MYCYLIVSLDLDVFCLMEKGSLGSFGMCLVLVDVLDSYNYCLDSVHEFAYVVM